MDSNPMGLPTERMSDERFQALWNKYGNVFDPPRTPELYEFMEEESLRKLEEIEGKRPVRRREE